jgi:hypothetical protein
LIFDAIAPKLGFVRDLCTVRAAAYNRGSNSDGRNAAVGGW